MNVVIRPARASDAATMAAIFDAAARASWSHFISPSALATLASGPEAFERAVARNSALVADLDGAVVAFAVSRPSADEDVDPERVGELDTIYALPSVWGAAVGRRLLAAVVDSLHDQGFAEATLWTAEQNERPRRIYERAGWTLDGARRTKTWLGATFDELRCRRLLDDRR